MAEPVGRPEIIDDLILQKLEYVFSIGGTDLEACFFSGISKSTLYNYQNDHPEFVERKEKLKESPILKARETIMNNLHEPENARWYLERKRKDEFSSKSEVEHKGELEIKKMYEFFNSDGADTKTNSEAV